MKVSEIKPNRLFMVIYITVAVFYFTVMAVASSDPEHGETVAKGWVSTDTYRVFNFAALAIGLYFILRKPVSKLLKSRIEGIQVQLSQLEAKKKAAEKKLLEYEEKLKLLDLEAEKIVAEYVRQGNEAKARILEEAEKASKRLEEQARRNIEHEFGQAKLKLQIDIMEKALQKAEQLIKDKITPEDQDKLVDEYLKKVVVS